MDDTDDLQNMLSADGQRKLRRVAQLDDLIELQLRPRSRFIRTRLSELETEDECPGHIDDLIIRLARLAGCRDTALRLMSRLLDELMESAS